MWDSSPGALAPGSTQLHEETVFRLVSDHSPRLSLDSTRSIASLNTLSILADFC